MKFKNNIFKLFLVLGILAFSSCETFDLDQTENPSTLPQSYLDPTFTFNYVQLTLPDFVNSANSYTQRITRQMAMTGGNTYNNAFAPVNFDNNWTTGYLILNAIKQMEPKAIENNQTYILGASKMIRCYVLMTLVDLYGNIPYSQALLGNDNLTPSFDSGADVYAGVYEELNQAIALMQDGASDEFIRDLYYGTAEAGSTDKVRWIKFANTLKLKMLYTSRLNNTIGIYSISSEVSNILAANNYIDEPSEDFEFRYGTERDLPNSRHPLYNDHYEAGGGAYIANYFMWAVGREKKEPSVGAPNSTAYPFFDPRSSYYFYRQILSTDGDNQTLPCINVTRPDQYLNGEYYSFYNPEGSSNPIAAAYCTTNIVNSQKSFAYWGRDHGDNSGIPADAELRTVVGLYPAGGAISPNNVATAVAATIDDGGTRGALGQGIMPILMSSFVHFMKAELVLELGVTGDAKASLLQGIADSVTKVSTFLPQQPGEPDDATVAAQTAAYVAFVDAAYTSANAAQKLEIIVKEFYIAAWGNGIEPYNNYRRTGYPSNFQPTRELDSGAFFYSALYPGVSVNNNPNAPSNVRTRRVFWDAGLTLH